MIQYVALWHSLKAGSRRCRNLAEMERIHAVGLSESWSTMSRLMQINWAHGWRRVHWTRTDSPR